MLYHTVGGGVALYIRDNLSFTIRNDLVPVQLEMICVEINLPYNRSFLVSTWYRPPNANIDLFTEYSSFVEKCDYEDKHLIILGDMNCDYLKDPVEHHTRKLQFLSSVYQLEQLISNPTRVTDKSSALIDLAFTNDVNNIAKSGVIHCGMSDHNIIYVVRKFVPPKRQEIKKEIRNLKYFVAEHFIHDLSNMPWEDIENIDNPNVAWKFWESNFKTVLDRHAPIRHKRVKRSSIPWLNSDIKQMMRNRDFHKKQSVKHGSGYHWRLYQTLRNKVNTEIRKNKSYYFREKIAECNINDPKNTWKLLNSLMGRNNKSNLIKEIKIDDKTITENDHISEAFNDFFINIGSTLASDVTRLSPNNVNTYLKLPDSNSPSFHFTYIPVENVLMTLRHLKVFKSTGIDKIPAKMLRIAADVIAPSLTYIFNLSLSTGEFVDDWKNARVTPIYKDGNRQIVGNYRPISVLPIISKIFEKEIFQQLYKYMNENNLISKFQSGFRPGYSTLSALIQMCDAWFNNMDNGELTGVVFLDIQKAFDSIDHDVLLEKMIFYGVSQNELKWFQSYLTNRYQQCQINGVLSKKGKTISGVPQGSILGPLLFLIYINDLPNCLKSTVPCLYADDTQIFTSSHDPTKISDNLNSDLENITDWLIVNKLQSHPTKTKMMVIGSRHNLNVKVADLRSNIKINNNDVSPVFSQKCLGIYLDERLAFDVHIEKLCKKICAGIGVLRRIKPFVPRDSLLKLYKSLIQPYFDYCSPLWDTCAKTLKDNLQTLQNRAARVISGENYDVRSEDILQSLKLDSLDVRRKKLKSVLLYKVLNGISAPCLRENLVRLNVLPRGYELRDSETDLKLPKPKTNFLKRSFQYSASTLWNDLSTEAKKATNLNEFKRLISNVPFVEAV